MDYTPKVLRARGVPVTVAVIEHDAAGAPIGAALKPDHEPLEGEEPTEAYLTEVAFVRFDYNVIADLEEKWGGVAMFQAAMEHAPVSTVRSTLALVWGVDEKHVGWRLLPGEHVQYQNAVNVAWALANGLDPFSQAALLKKAQESRAQERLALAEVVAEAEAEMDAEMAETEPQTAEHPPTNDSPGASS